MVAIAQSLHAVPNSSIYTFLSPQTHLPRQRTLPAQLSMLKNRNEKENCSAKPSDEKYQSYHLSTLCVNGQKRDKIV